MSSFTPQKLSETRKVFMKNTMINFMSFWRSSLLVRRFSPRLIVFLYLFQFCSHIYFWYRENPEKRTRTLLFLRREKLVKHHRTAATSRRTTAICWTLAIGGCTKNFQPRASQPIQKFFCNYILLLPNKQVVDTSSVYMLFVWWWACVEFVFVLKSPAHIATTHSICAGVCNLYWEPSFQRSTILFFANSNEFHKQKCSNIKTCVRNAKKYTK